MEKGGLIGLMFCARKILFGKNERCILYIVDMLYERGEFVFFIIIGGRKERKENWDL